MMFGMRSTYVDASGAEFLRLGCHALDLDEITMMLRIDVVLVEL